MAATIIDLNTGQEASVDASAQPGPGAGTEIELRRARRRIAQLEKDLARVTRESLEIFNRAREAERRLRELTGEECGRDTVRRRSRRHGQGGADHP